MNLDYRLNIKQEHKTFGPTAELINPISNSDNRIFEISCKSGSGKTFLLNLIAYALEANKLGDEYILPSLKESVSRYNKEEFYDLTYDINLKLPDGRNLILKKDSDSDKIIQYENQPQINYHSLHKRVTVLYDVPSNPSERLNGVIKDLGIWNDNIKNKIKHHTGFLNDLKRNFGNERDSEKIKKYQKEIEILEKKIKSCEHRLNDKNKTLSVLKIIQSLTKLQDLLKKEYKIKNDITEAENSLIDLKRPSRSSTKDLSKLRILESDFIKNNNIYNNRISELKVIFLSKQDLCKYINQTSGLNTTYKFISESLDFEKVFSNEDPLKIVANKLQKLSDFKKYITSFISQENSGEKYKLNESLKDFLKVINKFKETDSMSVLERITNTKEDILENEINKALINNKIIDYSKVSEFLKYSFSDINSALKAAEKIKKEIVKENKKSDVKASDKKYTQLSVRLRSAKDEYEDLTKDKERVKSFCFNAMGISDITKLENSTFLQDSIYSYNQKVASTDLEDVLVTIKNIEQDIFNTKIESKKNEDNKKFIEARLEVENNRKSGGEYSDVEKAKIEKFIHNLNMTITNTSAFTEIIKNINDGDLSKYADREDKSFMEVAGRIIAYSMDNKLLSSDGEYIELHTYDLLKQSFHCSGNIIIQRDDVSTGLASANYLKQRIDNVQGDYVVILLDEIGNMSGDILKEVLKSIKKLEKENRLVLALLTHPNTSNMNIISH